MGGSPEVRRPVGRGGRRHVLHRHHEGRLVRHAPWWSWTARAGSGSARTACPRRRPAAPTASTPSIRKGRCGEPRSCSSAAPWAPSSAGGAHAGRRHLLRAVQHPGESGDEWKAFGRVSTFDDPSTRWPDFKPGVPPRPRSWRSRGRRQDRRLIHRPGGRRGARRRAGLRRSGADPRRDHRLCAALRRR